MIEIFFDGACGPVNPGGTAAYGWLIKKDGKLIKEGCGVIGSGEGMTNNVAEYYGVLEGVKAYLKLGLKGDLTITGDSNMVCNMLSKKWGWKKEEWDPHPKFPHLRTLLDQAHILLEGINYKVQWIPREKNFEADTLSKKPLIELGLASEELEYAKCEKCGGKMFKRKGNYGEFLGCSNYPKCKNTQKVS